LAFTAEDRERLGVIRASYGDVTARSGRLAARQARFVGEGTGWTDYALWKALLRAVGPDRVRSAREAVLLAEGARER